MKPIVRAIDRFCYRHPKFGVKRLYFYLIASQILCYLIIQMDQSGTFAYYLRFDAGYIIQGEVWRIITWLAVPETDQIIFMLLELYFLYFISASLERAWGAGKVTIFYFSGALLLMIYAFVMYFIPTRLYPIDVAEMYGGVVSAAQTVIYKADKPIISSLYLNMSLFIAFASVFPNERLLLFFIIPIKVKWLAIASLAFSAYSVVTYIIAGWYTQAAVPVIALLNVLLIIGLPKTNVKNRAAAARKNIVFKNEVRAAETKYINRCVVCGRSDETNPNLQFRYKSVGGEYVCLCEDHIDGRM